MVHVLADLAYSHSHHAGHSLNPEKGDGSWAGPGRQEHGMTSREEHAQRMKELNVKRSLMRAPRRGWSMTDYQGDGGIPQVPHSFMLMQIERPAPIPENTALPPTAAPSPAAPSTPVTEKTPKAAASQLPSRPKLPPPRRSYSVMDYEPVPPDQPKPSTRLTLLDLPSEIHYLVDDYLDPIDSVCFGLAHSRLYAIHRRKHPGKIPLSSRYSGPNDMEWAWRGAGRLVRSPTAERGEQITGELSRMRVKGQVYCRKCGTSRCELHRHLREWMGPGREYCDIKEMYGPVPGEGAKPYCYMSSPKNPHRCGRHGERKSAYM